jgi:hypothetical protein
MADLALLALALAFFALCRAYVRGCDRIIAGRAEPGREETGR